MLMIRLQRLGKSKRPSYRMIVSDKHHDPQAGHVEILGLYNPSETPKVTKVDAERVKYWISVGAQPSSTVHNLLINLGVITGKKQRSITVSNKRRVALDKKKKADGTKAV